MKIRIGLGIGLVRLACRPPPVAAPFLQRPPRAQQGPVGSRVGLDMRVKLDFGSGFVSSVSIAVVSTARFKVQTNV